MAAPEPNRLPDLGPPVCAFCARTEADRPDRGPVTVHAGWTAPMHAACFDAVHRGGLD